MDLKGVFDKLSQYKKIMEFNEPATEAEIEEFQKENNNVLPPPFIELLKRFDGGELFIPGTRIYGISRKRNDVTIKDVNGKKNRKIFGIPLSMMIIGKLNYGDWLCIELNNRYEIIQWDHENDEEFCRWESLEEWVQENIEEYDLGGA